MSRIAFPGLLALAALTLAAGAAQAGYPHYPYGWYRPQSPYWVRWHGLREVPMPPSGTQWIANPHAPVPCGPMVLFQPIGCLPGAPPKKEKKHSWCPCFKDSVTRPTISEICPDCRPPWGDWLP